MDAIDNPDHGENAYVNGIRVVARPFDPARQQHADAAIAPSGGPIFPAVEDVQISAVPT